MEFLLITITVLFCSLQNVTQKNYNLKTTNGRFIFLAISALCAMCVFILSGGKLDFSVEFLPYSFGFALAYLGATIFSLLSLAYGSLSLTSLIVSYSLIIPTIYGLIFASENIKPCFIPGIILLVISLFLVNKSDRNEKKHINTKWLIAVSLAFLSNGMCSTVQKMQQTKFGDLYKDEFMIVALLTVSISSLLCSFIRERANIVECIKKGGIYAIFCGFMNGAVNLFVILLLGKMPSSVMFPIISAGGIIITFFISKFFYKEKSSKNQIVGFILGIASIILLNI